VDCGASGGLASTPVSGSIRHFSCTQCGACCNRSPEVELSEAAALADVFVFRLMFRFYALPRNLTDYVSSRASEPNTSETFYQKKRLLSANAALKRSSKLQRNGRRIEYTQYLTMSALSLDTRAGACSALAGSRCGIYSRRPHACRTVPFHYSRVDALAESDLDAFVASDGYRCDTSDGTPIVIRSGRIVEEGMKAARAAALAATESDRRWRDGIVRQMKRGASGYASMPSLGEIEAAASIGPATTSMRVAWQVAAELALIDAKEYQSLLATQLALIDRELAAKGPPPDARETLLEMRAEYARELRA
jgi:Fe-S-cluster containining protein